MNVNVFQCFKNMRIINKKIIKTGFKFSYSKVNHGSISRISIACSIMLRRIHKYSKADILMFNANLI